MCEDCTPVDLDAGSHPGLDDAGTCFQRVGYCDGLGFVAGEIYCQT